MRRVHICIRPHCDCISRMWCSCCCLFFRYDNLLLVFWVFLFCLFYISLSIKYYFRVWLFCLFFSLRLLLFSFAMFAFLLFRSYYSTDNLNTGIQCSGSVCRAVGRRHQRSASAATYRYTHVHAINKTPLNRGYISYTPFMTLA